MRQLPHILTLLRLAASPFLGWLILQAHFEGALGVVCLAGLTDWFDGYAARRLGVTGKFGIVLDPLADKAMLVTLFLALTYVHVIPIWVTVLVMARDIIIVAGALLLRMLRGIRQFLPSTMGKVSTFFQIAFVAVALLYAAFPVVVLLWLKVAGLVLTAAFTTWSGIDYVKLGVQMARRESSSGI